VDKNRAQICSKKNKSSADDFEIFNEQKRLTELDGKGRRCTVNTGVSGLDHMRKLTDVFWKLERRRGVWNFLSAKFPDTILTEHDALVPRTIFKVPNHQFGIGKVCKLKNEINFCYFAVPGWRRR
jgi:hypothetical protein